VKLVVHAGLKNLWSGMAVRVRLPPDVQKYASVVPVVF